MKTDSCTLATAWYIRCLDIMHPCRVPCLPYQRGKNGGPWSAAKHLAPFARAARNFRGTDSDPHSTSHYFHCVSNVYSTQQDQQRTSSGILGTGECDPFTCASGDLTRRSKVSRKA